jgi:hypothetical protein
METLYQKSKCYQTGHTSNTLGPALCQAQSNKPQPQHRGNQISTMEEKVSCQRKKDCLIKQSRPRLS